MRGQGSIQAAMREISKELTRAKGRAQLLNKQLADGTYQKAANQLAQIRRQYASMMQTARLQDLIAEHGRFGASLVMLQERMSGMSRAAAYGLGILTATTMGWVTAGMAGTVEAYRLQMGFTLLSRQIASVFKPTIDDATGWLFRATRWFQNLSGSQQETIRTTVLVSAGLLGGIVVINLAVKAFASLRAMLLATSVAMKAVAATSSASGLVGFMNASSRMRTLLLAGGIGAGLLALHEGTKGPTDHPADRSVVEKGFDTAGRSLTSLWDETLGRFWTTGEERSKKRRRRFLEEREQWDMLGASEAKELAAIRKAEKGKRSDVTLNQTGFEEIGSAWDRMANEVLKMSDPAERAANTLETIKETLLRLEEEGKLERGSVRRMMEMTKEMPR